MILARGASGKQRLRLALMLAQKDDGERSVQKALPMRTFFCSRTNWPVKRVYEDELVAASRIPPKGVMR